MSDKQQPDEVQVIPDMFGFNLHYEGSKFHIPNEQLLLVVRSLLHWLPFDDEAKGLLMAVSIQHGIATEDLFPGDSAVTSDHALAQQSAENG